MIKAKNRRAYARKFCERTLCWIPQKNYWGAAIEI